MKLPSKLIVFLVLISLTGIFLYQGYWVMGLYSSMKKDMEKNIIDAIRISDYNEIMVRIDSLKKSAEESARHGKIEASIGSVNDSTYMNVTSTIEPDSINERQSMAVSDEPFETVINKNASVEILAMNLQRGIHAGLDIFTTVNIQVFDSLLTESLTSHGIKSPHRSEIINLEDSTIISFASPDNTYIPSGKALSFDYSYDMYGKYCYRLWLEPINTLVLKQMTGILITSLLIIILLSFSFWFLIRTILRQKTIEEMKEDFTHNITHELKTPIAVAYAANDALLNFSQAENKEKRKQYLKIIQEQLKYLSGMVEQILSMSMEQRKSFRLLPVKIVLKDMLAELIGQHELKSDKPIEIKLNVLPENLIIEADRTHLYNMVSNLMDNAIKYSRGKAFLAIEAYLRDGMITISVSDKGIGIPADKQKYVFDKFYRVPTGNLHDVKGYGLGLFYVKTMVEKHNGIIEIESTPGKGSTFTIQIPQNL